MGSEFESRAVTRVDAAGHEEEGAHLAAGRRAQLVLQRLGQHLLRVRGRVRGRGRGRVRGRVRGRGRGRGRVRVRVRVRAAPR